VMRSEIRWSKYKKVPIVLCNGDDPEMPLVSDVYEFSYCCRKLSPVTELAYFRDFLCPIIRFLLLINRDVRFIFLLNLSFVTRTCRSVV